jgi:hypothetical protein
MGGKPLAICGICGCDPCDCHGATSVELVVLTYKVGDKSFTLHVPKRLVRQYTSLYKELEVMRADGSVVVYSGGVVTEKSNENQ